MLIDPLSKLEIYKLPVSATRPKPVRIVILENVKLFYPIEELSKLVLPEQLNRALVTSYPYLAEMQIGDICL